MNIIELKDVCYEYQSKEQTVQVVDHVFASFETGKVQTIVGISGSGKTTILSLLAGLDYPTTGEVLYEGKPTTSIPAEDYRRTCVAVIYQSFRLLPLLTVEENVMYPMELNKVPIKKSREKAHELIRSVGLTEKVFLRFPAMLSGGEQQRVAIARALAMPGKVILADEPTGNLDKGNAKNVMEILKKLAHELDYCVIMVTHDPKLKDASDVVYHMEEGQLTKE